MPTSRPRFRRSLLLCFLAVTILLAGAAMTGSADSHVTLTVDDSTPVPAETIEFEGENYEIDATTVRDPGHEFTAEVTLPDEEFTTVDFLLYNSDQQIEASKGVNRPSTSETATFETESYAPGTYMLNIELEGATEQMQPVVIAGYDLTIDYPEDLPRDENVDITAEVTPTELSAAPAGVEVVVWNESHSQTFEMDHSNDETYTTSIELDQFETGEYTVNVAALGDETFRGQQEVLALESSSLTIQETTSSDGTDNSDSGGNDGTGSDDSTDGGTGGTDDSTNDGSSSNDGSSETNDTASDDDMSSDSDTLSSDDDSSSETDNTTDGTDGAATNGSDGSGTSDTGNSDDNVIEPNENSSSENTDDQVSLFAVQGVFLLVIVVVSVRRLRH
ncbi:hypothetical protein DJ73_06170 [Halorubrum sp. Ea1]|uniref:hypothetical protein n=1 Tax=Halorubrum sp. Ea1 TaxID=1480718 RepID=UPI000BDA6657|nr:hypothetical protein [Halorubrum sp. Ea1]OYR53884.1 hypothetical protein DJ73_06170 [Halorubrum sp. Ea1]